MILNVVLFYSIRGLLSEEEELIQEFRKQDYSVRCYYNKDYQLKNYIVELDIEDISKMLNYEDVSRILKRISKYYCMRNKIEYDESSGDKTFESNTEKYKFIDFHKYHLSSDQKEMKEFFMHLQSKNQFNYRIIFNFKNMKYVHFLELFIKTFKENKIERIDLFYHIDGHLFRYPYYKDLCDLVCYTDHIRIKSQRAEGSFFYDEERILDDEYISKLLNEYSNIYLEKISETRVVNFIKKYLLNHKLLLLDINRIEEDEKLLDFESKKIKPFPKLKYFNVLFNFFKDSATFIDIITESLNNELLGHGTLFYSIIESLKIDFTMCNEKSLSDDKRSSCNEIKDICEKIRMLDLKENVKSYKLLLKYVYIVFKRKFPEIDNVLKEFKKIMNDDILKDIKSVIFSKIIKNQALICNQKIPQYQTYFYNENMDLIPEIGL